MATMLQVRFECHTLPAPGALAPTCQRLGIQEGKAVIQDIALAGQDEIHFQFPLQLEVEPVSGMVIFRGKYVQGPRADPFVYLCWGDRAEGTWMQCGRSKIPLGAIPRALIDRALRDGAVLQARIRLTNRQGNPAFATLKADQVTWME